MDCGPDGKAFKRLNAIHLLLLGAAYQLVLRNSRVSGRTFRLWVARFNRLGINGLTYRPYTGRPRKLAPAQVTSEILPLVDQPALAEQTHWTLTKLCGWLREEKQLDLSYRTLVRYLHEHNYARRIPRRVPEPPDRDTWEQDREAFAGGLLDLLASPGAEVFFGDEAGFEGDPRPRSKWVKRGSRPTQGYFGGHVRQNVVGAVNPTTGQLVSLIVPHCDTEVFQAFLDTMAVEVPPAAGKRVILVLDNAGWHKTKRLNWHHLEPHYLPPYSPDFNPIERLWQHLKSHYLAGYLTKSGHELSDKIYHSIRDLLKRPETIRSVCKTHSE
ncbi:MAG: IS630 family transposase [Planctomycetaceae bacterium]|nr:IS630 family transposase [Planctomycetaceae bacterium]